MLFLIGNLRAQNVDYDKWSQFIEISSGIKNEKKEFESTYFLVTTNRDFLTDNCLEKGDSICRILDTSNFILKSTKANVLNYIGITHIQANNLWKLGPTHTVNNSNQIFSIKTSKPFLLKEKLNIVGAKDIIIKEYSVSARTSWLTILNEVLPLEHVTYINNECLKPIQESMVKDLDLSVNGIFKVLQLYPELNGGEQIIGVKDNLPNTNDIDLLNKIEVSSIASNINDTHATDMATIISGNGNSGAKGLGVLSGATIFPMDFNSLFPDDSIVLEEAGVTLINNSYGTTIENYYGVLAEAYDQFLYDNPTKLHIFSSGNSGSSTSENGPYQSIPNYANLTGNFKMAKNCITVGALDQNNIVLPFSSKGPAYDGRLKPEMVAYSILGTSNAAALVTGVAGILQQAYLKNENELPPTSLIKSTLLNGADDVGRPGIDFETGYGKLNALESLEIVNDQNYIVETIESNEVKTFEINIPTNAIDLKVMLVWTDTPALPNDNKALKNNLDITINNGVTTFFPLILNINPTLEAIEAEATAGIDTLNPVEQIVIPTPEAGNYTISVKAGNLETESQEFSLTYTWKSENVFEWTYPTVNAKFPYNGSNTGYVRWKSSFEQDKLARLEVSFDDLDTWEIVSEEVNLTTGFYKWEFLEELHSKAHLRFVIDGENEVSEVFTISSGLEVSTSLNCEDITEIIWNKKENTSQYGIYNLQNEKMELVSTTTDTTFVFSKEAYSNPYFSIAPLLDNSRETLRSDTVNTTEFPERCYFNYVFASLVDRNITIEVALSSMYNVKSIEGFRVNENGLLSQISSREESSEFLFYVLDNEPIDGENTYQFKVTTNNGEEYFSQETNVRYFSEQNPFLVFPNPTTPENGITIFSGLSQNETATFELYDLVGRLVLKTILSSDIAFVALNMASISKGLYVYKISGSTVNTKFAQKIVIQ